jgi:hypothetical protein
MSSCRATSFYLAPGVLRYFKDHTLAAVLPDGSWVAIKHRGDIARLKQEHPLWDGTVLCGRRGRGGLGELRSHIAADGSTVEVWHINDRIIEGRRPENAAVYALHKWAVTGDTQAVGGVRQLIETIAPGAPKSVRSALREAAERGEHHAVDVVAAAWRAGLMRNPDQIVELLKHSRIPFRSIPDPRLEQLLAGVVATGRNVDALAFIASMIDGSQMLDAGARRLLAEDATTTPAILQVLAMDTSVTVRIAVAENPNTPVATLELLAHDAYGFVRQSVADNPNTTARVLGLLALEEDEDMRHSVARHLNTPSVDLELLGHDTNTYIRMDVARNPNTPVAILELLARDHDYDVRVRVAEHPNTTATALEQLVREGDEEMRVLVARHLNTPVSVLEQLVGEEEEAEVCVADNPNTTAAVLELLAGSSAVVVRCHVARRSDAPAALLEQLAKDEDSHVVENVAGNPNAPVSVLEQLSTYRSTFVQAQVAGNPNTPVSVVEELLQSRNGMIRMAVAKSLNTTSATLEQLAKDSDNDVRSRVAGNPNTPGATLERLAQDWDDGVRSRVAENPNTPAAALEQLRDDENSQVQTLSIGNPNTSASDLDALAHGTVRARMAVAMHPNTPVATLEQMAQDSHEHVRQRVAENPNTPSDTVAQLTRNTVVLDGVQARRGDDHDDRYEYQAVKNNTLLELNTTTDLLYDVLAQYGAPAVDYPQTISDVRELGRANAQFGFADDTLKLRHTLAESTVTIENTVLTPRVISSPRALTENANYMGNCTAGYESYIRNNESLIIALDDKTTPQGDTVYNVEIQRGESGRWDTIGEINSRFNNGVTDEEEGAIKTRVAAILQSM